MDIIDRGAGIHNPIIIIVGGRPIHNSVDIIDRGAGWPIHNVPGIMDQNVQEQWGECQSITIGIL